MKIYNLMVNSGTMASSHLFEKKEDALSYVEWLEEGQQRLEGNGLIHVFHYGATEMVTPPFFVEGKRIYCSRAVNALSEVFTWRVIYEQELN